MAVKLSPIFVAQQFFNSAGNVLAGGQIFQYLAGTTTPASTFTDSTGSTPNANPITLDSAGRYSNQIWMTVGTTYKLVLKDSGGTTILTEDNITGVNDTSSGAASEWVLQGTPTYVSGTSFTVNGNQTTVFQVGRRVQAQINSGFIYGTISSSTFSSVTTVVVVNDSGALDATLSSVSVGLLGETNPSVPSIIPYPISIIQNTWPFFHAHLSANQTSGTTVIFDTVDNQLGGTNYSNSTGIFTAPFTGWYLFVSDLMFNNTSGGAVTTASVSLFLNGNNVANQGAPSVPNNGQFPFSVSAVSFLSSGQTAKVITQFSLTGTQVIQGGNLASIVASHFSGSLLQRTA